MVVKQPFWISPRAASAERGVLISTVGGEIVHPGASSCVWALYCERPVSEPAPAVQNPGAESEFFFRAGNEGTTREVRGSNEGASRWPPGGSQPAAVRRPSCLARSVADC